jgi:hypothetical protein
VETDFRARSAGPPALAAGSRADCCQAPIEGCSSPALTRPGIVAAVFSFLFAIGANITGPQRCSTDPFGGAFWLKIEFHLDSLAERFANLAINCGEFAGRSRCAGQ